MHELLEANRRGTGILMVTHSVKVAARSERVIYLMDGGIEGELILGKMEDENDLREREKTLNAWLIERGW